MQPQKGKVTKESFLPSYYKVTEENCKRDDWLKMEEQELLEKNQQQNAP